MQYMDRETKQYPLNRHDVLIRNMQVGLKTVWDELDLAILGVYEVYPTQCLLPVAPNQEAVEGPPKYDHTDKKWYQTWAVRTLSDDEMAVKTTNRWKELRSIRNNALQQSDSMVLPDLWEQYTDEEKALWREYRQALRDVPANTEDPFTVPWPQHPTRKPGGHLR